MSNDSDIDIELTLQELAQNLIYTTEEKWATSAFVLLVGRASLQIRELIKDYMESAGVPTVESPTSKIEDLKPGKKLPSLCFRIGGILNKFTERRLKDAMKYKEIRRTQRSESTILSQIIYNLIPLLDRRLINWMDIKPAKSKDSQGSRYNPELFRQFSRMAKYLPRELITDDIPYTHYVFIVQMNQELLSNHREEIPRLMKLIIEEAKRGTWNTTNTQNLRDNIGKITINNRFPKPPRMQWDRYFWTLMNEALM